VGKAIGQSRMPRLQRYLAQLHGFDLEYLLHDFEHIAAAQPMHYILRLQDEGCDGLNVTHPFKQAVVPLVSRAVVPDHAAVGAYNTLVFREGSILGGNTDYSGFLRAWRYRFGGQLPGRVLLAGAGGVGHAVAHALARLGAEQMLVADLDSGKAAALSTSLQGTAGDVQVIAADAIADHMQQCDGLVNCTTLGTLQHPGSPFSAEHTGPQRWAFDAVYTPLHTTFLQQCRKAGLTTLTGFDLWIFQGVDAFNLFTGASISVDEQVIETTLAWLD